MCWDIHPEEMQEGYKHRRGERMKSVGASQEKMVLSHLAALLSHRFLHTSS